RPGKRSQRQPETLDSNRQQYSGFPRRDMTVFSPPNYKFSPKLKFILVLVISAAQERVSQYTGSKHVFRLRAAVRTLGGLSLATRLEFEAWDFFDSVSKRVRGKADPREYSSGFCVDAYSGECVPTSAQRKGWTQETTEMFIASVSTL